MSSEELMNLYESCIAPDILLLPEGSSNFARAIPISAELLSSVVPVLAPKVAEAREVTRLMGARRPRSLLSGVHPGTTCTATGTTPILGYRYHSETLGDLCASAYDQLSPGSQAAYRRCAPTVYPRCRGTFYEYYDEDDDDGHPGLALPGTRRAIKLLARVCLETSLPAEAFDAFCADGYTVVRVELESHLKVLCEYIELCDRIQAPDEFVKLSAEGALEGYDDSKFDDADEASLYLRLFCALSKRLVRGQPSKQWQEWINFSAEAVISRLITPRPDSALVAPASTLDELLAPALASMELPQLAAFVDALPPVRSEGPLHVYDENMFDMRSDWGSINRIGKITLAPEGPQDGSHMQISSLEIIKQLNGVLSVRVDHPSGDHLLTTYRAKIVISSPKNPAWSKQEIALELMDFQCSSLACKGTGGARTESSDTALRPLLLLPCSERPCRACKPRSRAVDASDLSELASMADGAPEEQPPASTASESGATAKMAALAKLLRVRIELQRRSDDRRRSILAQWACSHGLECAAAAPSLLQLISYYDAQLQAYEQRQRAPGMPGPSSEPSPADPATTSTKQPVGLFGTVQAGSAAVDALRTTLLDRSLFSHVAHHPPSLQQLVRDSAAQLSAETLQRLLEARPAPPEALPDALETSPAAPDAATSLATTPSAATPGASALGAAATGDGVPSATSDPAGPSTRVDGSSGADEGPWRRGAIEAPTKIAPTDRAAEGDGSHPLAESPEKESAEKESTEKESTEKAPRPLARPLAVREEIALLEALRPWAARATVEQLLLVLRGLRVDLLPLDTLRAHVQQRDGVLRDAAREGSPLRAALSDALLPGIGQLRGMALEDEPPHDLTCCITLSLMTDPVVAMDGKSYERSAIEAYFAKAGSPRPASPITREPLTSQTLVPNVNLRALCREYAAKHKRGRLAAASPQDVVMGALLSPPPAMRLEAPAVRLPSAPSTDATVIGAKRKLDSSMQSTTPLNEPSPKRCIAS